MVVSNVAPYSSNDQAVTLRMGRVAWVKGVNCIVIDRNKIFGGEHIVVYTEVGI